MLTIETILKATKGVLLQEGKLLQVKGVSINSRTFKRGYAFVAIKGERFDGHRFVMAAVRKGASAVIVSQSVSVPKTISVIKVQDTTKALGQMARAHRQQFSIPIIALTGSAGKTTTKELIAAILQSKYKVLKNIKTENNHIGVPLTLFKLNHSHEVAVLEMGTNQKGDIRWLTKVAEPTMAIYTNVGDSHLEGLKSRSGVFKEKSDLLKYMPSPKRVIFNADDPYLRNVAKGQYVAEKISYGIKKRANFRVEQVEMLNDCAIEFRVQKRKFVINTPAQHNLYNALAAISSGRYLKVSYNNIKDSLKNFKFDSSRLQIKKIGRSWLIDDTYNANPISFQSAVQTLSDFSMKGKKVIVCADMLELGRQSRKHHESMGSMIAASQIDLIFTFGNHSKYLQQSVKRQNDSIHAVHKQSLSDIYKGLRQYCEPGDMILVKGSRGMHMERVVNYLEKLLVKLK